MSTLSVTSPQQTEQSDAETESYDEWVQRMADEAPPMTQDVAMSLIGCFSPRQVVAPRLREHL